jgi:hypothetical protein
MTAFLSERGFGIGYALMLLGVIILLDGFAVDAWLHAEDQDLAAEEGLFTLSNPGHLFIAIGLTLIIIGACIGPYTRWVLPSRSVVLAMFVPAVALGLALAFSTGFAYLLNDLSHEDESHSHAASTQPADDHATSTQSTDDHAAEPAVVFPHPVAPAGGSTEPEAATEHTAHDMSRVLPEHTGTVTLAESTMHEPPNTQPITRDTLVFAETFLADARAATEKYKDVSVAQADGYFRITPDLPLIGAHFFRPGSEGLDPANPSILLYKGDGDGNWTLVGMAYQVPKTIGDDVPPETGLGGLAGWHYHTNLCFIGGGGVLIAPSAENCPGQFVAETGWLLHVWAWSDSPEGVFDHANSLLQ